jgi:capsular exopolysaccharide synthesis family protein
MAPSQAEITNHYTDRMPVVFTEDDLPSNVVRPLTHDWQETEEVQLRDYIDVILRRKWLILTVLALVFLSTSIFTLAVTRIYEASAVLEVSQETPRVTTFQEVLGSEIQAREFYETQVELLSSRAMIDRVIDKLNLVNHTTIRKAVFGEGDAGVRHWIGKTLKSLAKSLVRGPKPPAEVDAISMHQQLAEYVSDNLTVTPSRKSMLIDVAFRSPDRQLSQDVVNTLIDDFINWKMELKIDASGIARDFLMMQMDRAKINLESAEERLNQFAKHAGIVSLDARLNSIYRHLEELNSSFAVAESDMIAKRADYLQAVGGDHATLPRVLQSDLIASLKNKYAELNAEYEELKEVFHDDYPKVRSLKARMDSIAALIKAQEDGVVLSIQNEYESAREVVEAMEQRIEQQKALVLDLNERATQYSIMAREVETNKEIFQSLLQRTKEIESMAGVSTSNIQVVNRAHLPLDPVKPNVKINLLLALVLGLLGGIGCSFLAEYFADTVVHPSELSDRFQLPLLGTIPQVKPDKQGLESSFLYHPRSSFAEAIRSTRVSVQLSGSGTRSKCFLVTSTLPSEGKTTLAVNLAMSFAAAGERTVVIDADLRKPRLHEVFNLKERVNGNGVSSFLAELTSRLKIYNGQVKNLHIIPSGPTPPNPAELLASLRFKRLLGKLTDQYDRIILDGPPHIGFADTLILSKIVGGIVLVSSVGESSREAIGQFKRSIHNVNGAILGCIVNKVDFNRKYGYGGYYKAYHTYSSFRTEDQEIKALHEKPV